jgi:hypothetical protein
MPSSSSRTYAPQITCPWPLVVVLEREVAVADLLSYGAFVVARPRTRSGRDRPAAAQGGPTLYVYVRALSLLSLSGRSCITHRMYLHVIVRCTCLVCVIPKDAVLSVKTTAIADLLSDAELYGVRPDLFVTAVAQCNAQ